MLTFRLNGESVHVGDVKPETTLLEFLRARGLTGSKEGCAEGECGACAVAMVAPRGDQNSQYRVINSCLMLAPMAADHEVYTIEALARDGVLLAAQQAMAEAGGSQCGYCTPGFVMSLFAEQHRPDRRGPCDSHALAGNLCRCTGYRPIRDAVRSVGAAPAGPWLDRLTRPAPTVTPVACVGFSRPGSLAECIDQLREIPGAKLVAGATDLGVESNLRYRRWPHLVSLEGVTELRAFVDSPHEVRIGAGLTLADIGERWHDAPRAFHRWLELFASPLIRNRATLGGNLATGSPIGDAAPLLLAMNASVELASATGRRVVALDTFFTGYRATALQPAEVMTTVVVPKPFPAALSFYKVAKRRMDDISTLATAMAVDRNDEGLATRVRFAFGGVAATPIRAIAAEQAAEGRAWSLATVARVQHILADTLAPLSDHRGSREYRLAVAQSLVEKFWTEHSG